MATLYLVSTPIGNLSDLSARAGVVLGGVSRVLAEDTRRSRILLKHLGIDTPLHEKLTRMVHEVEEKKRPITPGNFEDPFFQTFK